MKQKTVLVLIAMSLTGAMAFANPPGSGENPKPTCPAESDNTTKQVDLRKSESTVVPSSSAVGAHEAPVKKE